MRICNVGQYAIMPYALAVHFLVPIIIFIFIHKNGRQKYTCNNTKKIKSERKIKASNLNKQIKICKPLQKQFMIYSSMNQIDIEH